MHIDGFLPHDAMHSADYAVAKYPFVCLSVRVSHAGRPVMSKRINVSSNFFTWGNHTILVFFIHQRLWQYSDRDVMGMKKSDVRQIPRFISEMTQNRATVTMKRQQELDLPNGTTFSNLE